MLKQGVDCNAKDDIGFTALMESARDKHPGMVGLLLANQANPQLISYDSSLNLAAIHLAAIGGNLEVIDILNEYKANLNAQSMQGLTAMHWAIYEGNTLAAQHLITLGANGDLKDETGKSANDIIAP